MNPIPLSNSQHLGASWVQPDNYFHAQNATLAALSVVEISKVAAALPFGFAKQGDKITPVAVLGLPQQKKLVC